MKNFRSLSDGIHKIANYLQSLACLYPRRVWQAFYFKTEYLESKESTQIKTGQQLDLQLLQIQRHYL